MNADFLSGFFICVHLCSSAVKRLSAPERGRGVKPSNPGSWRRKRAFGGGGFARSDSSPAGGWQWSAASYEEQFLAALTDVVLAFRLEQRPFDFFLEQRREHEQRIRRE